MEPDDYSRVLREYLQSGLLERMLDEGYATLPAKSGDYPGARGRDYLIDQSQRTHILNGLFAITRLMEYLARHDLLALEEEDFRRVLVLYTTHDTHKLPGVEKRGRGEFDIDLNDVWAQAERLGVTTFVHTTPEEHRLAMVHLRSPKVGDLSHAPRGTSRLLTFVRLADALASARTAREYATAEAYLSGLSPALARRRQAFYYHELDDYRGLSTQLVHQAVSALLEEEARVWPLLYFPNGVLYVGLAGTPLPTKESVVSRAVQIFFNSVTISAKDRAHNIARGALKSAQTVMFQSYVYLFADVATLLAVIRDRAARERVPHRFVADVAEKRADTGKYVSATAFFRTFALPETELDADLVAKWWSATEFLKGTESIIRDHAGDSAALQCLFETLKTPDDVRSAVVKRLPDLRSGGVADHCLVLAYHFLAEGRFGKQRKPAASVDRNLILQDLEELFSAPLAQYDSQEARLRIIDQDLCLRDSLRAYLEESLQLSWGTERVTHGALPSYARALRGQQHGRLCVYCNREIPKEMRDRIIKTGVSESEALVFSNRLLPRDTVVGQMVWCPMCYLEFMLRRVLGAGLPAGADRGRSRRLFLYLLPDYSLTPDFWRFTGRLLQAVVGPSSLKLRQYGSDDDPGLPALWLTEREADADTVVQVERLFLREAERLARNEGGRPAADMPGNRIVFTPVRSPNFQVAVFECSVQRGERGARLAATRTELWAKATYAACYLHLLLGVRVYVTERPYLPVSRPEDVRRMIELDAPAPLVKRVLPDGATISLSQIASALDRLSAVWEVNNALSGGEGNRDKQIAEVLERVATEPLAGASFYKERERDDRPIYAAVQAACEVLLDAYGGDKMDLAKRIADQSLDLFIPLRGRTGRAHRYENLFRIAVEAVKGNPHVDEDEMVARVAGLLLKRLDRADGGALPAFGADRAQKAEALARTVVRDLFVRRCRRSLARLTHEENALADGIYYVTSRQLDERWRAHQAHKETRGGNGHAAE